MSPLGENVAVRKDARICHSTTRARDLRRSRLRVHHVQSTDFSRVLPWFIALLLAHEKFKNLQPPFIPRSSPDVGAARPSNPVQNSSQSVRLFFFLPQKFNVAGCHQQNKPMWDFVSKRNVPHQGLCHAQMHKGEKTHIFLNFVHSHLLSFLLQHGVLCCSYITTPQIKNNRTHFLVLHYIMIYILFGLSVSSSKLD